MIKIEIKSVFGNVLFSYEKENNTIKKTLLEAVKSNANLRYANLRYTDLSGANFSGANLSGANLSDANLIYTDLSGANISGANLSDANLRYTDLIGANLSDANLIGANLSSANLSGANLSGAKNKETAYLPIFCKWTHSIKGDKIQIGCKKKTIEEWDVFFNSTEEYSTKRSTEEFKQIEAVYNAYKAYLTILNK